MWKLAPVCLFLPSVQVDVFAADTVVEGERRESLWTGDNVYPCILKVPLPPADIPTIFIFVTAD